MILGISITLGILASTIILMCLKIDTLEREIKRLTTHLEYKDTRYTNDINIKDHQISVLKNEIASLKVKIEKQDNEIKNLEQSKITLENTYIEANRQSSELKDRILEEIISVCYGYKNPSN